MITLNDYIDLIPKISHFMEHAVPKAIPNIFLKNILHNTDPMKMLDNYKKQLAEKYGLKKI